MNSSVARRVRRTLNAVKHVVPGGMAPFHRAGETRINVFPVEDTYMFKHYFEENVFDELKRYYSSYDYRFEVPEPEFDAVRDILETSGYAPIVVEEIEPFTVVQRKYTEHPKILFKGSVFHRSVGNFNVFVMKNQDAVEQAVNQGVAHLTDADVGLTF